MRRDDFPEVLQFVHEMDAHYGLQLKLLHGDFKAGLEHLVNVSGIHAIFLGTRRYTDDLEHGCMCMHACMN